MQRYSESQEGREGSDVPTSQGLPLELYFFTATTSWIPYEHIQADVFEHLLAMLPEFGIKAFQAPSGSDFAGYINDKAEA